MNKETLTAALAVDDNVVSANIILDRNHLTSDEDKKIFAENYFNNFDVFSYKVFPVIGVVQITAYASEFKKFLAHENIAGVNILENGDAPC